MVVSLALFLFAGAIAIFFKKPELALLLKIGSIYLFLNSFYTLASSIFLSLQKVKYSVIAETIFQISRIVLLFISFYIFKSIEGIFIILSLSLIFSLIFSSSVILKKYPFIIKGKKEGQTYTEKAHTQDHIGFGLLAKLQMPDQLLREMLLKKRSGIFF